MTIIKIQIRSAQNVGKVWVSWKNLEGPIWGHSMQFSPWTEQITKVYQICLVPLVGQWVLFTRFGFPCWCRDNVPSPLPFMADGLLADLAMLPAIQHMQLQHPLMLGQGML